MLDEHKKTLVLIAAVGVMLFITFWTSLGGGGAIDVVSLLTGQGREEGQLAKPRMSINDDRRYYAVLKTSEGDIKINLYEKDAGYTVNNFVYLAENDFYDGTKFHRIIKDFIIQCGAPLDDENGGPGYTFKDEINNHLIVKGTVAMAVDEPNTNGSQFFIVTEKAQPHLDGKHTVFGQVIEGMDIVTKISEAKVEDNGTGEVSRPMEDIILEDVEVIIE